MSDHTHTHSRLTKRGKSVITFTVAGALGVTLGMTAQYWDPVTRNLDKQVTNSHTSTSTSTTNSHTSSTSTNSHTSTADPYATTEDSPMWNCLTMGNHKCGPTYKPVPADIAYEEALPSGCLMDTSATAKPVIVCPDGSVR